MGRPYLTVLTLPILSAQRRAYQRIRGIARAVVKPGVPVPRPSPYPGHFALVRSVVEGLRSIRADFNFNPRRFGELAPVVYTPANEALRQAIELKKRGDVRYVVAGPVNALFADESDGILFAPEIDLLIVPSAWVLDFYRGFPQLIAKSRVCPCGVDAEVWKPSGRKKEQKALIYWKSGDERFCEAVEAVVRQSGLEPVRFQSRAGEHAIFKPEDYREGLVVSIVGIFLSTFETQGIALAEAWSMDVPTVVWDPQGEAEWRGRTFKAGSSAPFLTPATGAAFQTIGDLATVLRDTLRRLTEFQPRQWVLEHMTDAVCAEELYNLIRREAGAAEKPADIKDPAARSSAR